MHSLICIENKEGKIKGVYCNSNCELIKLGALLNECYKREQDVYSLIKKGNIDKFYYDDVLYEGHQVFRRKSTENKKPFQINYDQSFPNQEQELIYKYNCWNKQWSVSHYMEDKPTLFFNINMMLENKSIFKSFYISNPNIFVRDIYLNDLDLNYEIFTGLKRQILIYKDIIEKRKNNEPIDMGEIPDKETLDEMIKFCNKMKEQSDKEMKEIDECIKRLKIKNQDEII